MTSGYFRYVTFLVAATCMINLAVADDLTIPNEFQANTPARAADVNANFSAVEASVDDNAADIAANAASVAGNTTNITANTANIQANSDAIDAIPASSGLPVYSEGSEIGKLVDRDGSHLLLVSPQGFLFRVHSWRSPVEYLEQARSVFFSDPGCTGTAFIDSRNAWEDTVGYVFPVQGGPNMPSAFYAPRGGSPVIDGQVIQSVTESNSCRDWVDTRRVQEVFPNDPSITGVSDTAPNGPLMPGVP